MKRLILTMLLCLPQLMHGFDHEVADLEYISADELESMKQSGFQPEAYASDPWTVGVSQPCPRNQKCIGMVLVAAPVIAMAVKIVGVAIIAGVVGWAIKSETQTDKDRRSLGRSEWSPVYMSDEEVVGHWMHIAAHRSMIAQGLNENGLWGQIQLMAEKQNPDNAKHLKGAEYEDYIYAREKLILRGNRGTDEDPDPTGFPKLYKPIVSKKGVHGRFNEYTKEIYVRDPSNHGGRHWEVYRNRHEFNLGNRSHKVYENGQKFRYGNRRTLENKPLVR